MTLRVCRVINAMHMGGVQTQLMGLLPRLVERGAKIEVLCIRMHGELFYKIRRLPGISGGIVRVRGRFHPFSLRLLARHFARLRFDVVHTHMYSSNVPGTLAARWAGVPCIVSHIHNIDMYKSAGQKIADRLLMPLRDRVACVSEAVRDNTARHLRMRKSAFEVIYNGIDDRPKPNIPPREEVLSRLGIPSDAIVAAIVARLHPQKGHGAFLDGAAPRLFAEAPNLHVLFVGDGERRSALEARVREGGWSERAHFLGDRFDVPHWLSAADLSLLPSQKEGFSNVVLESMVYGAALVITDVGGAREQLRDGVDGYIVAPDAMAAFAERALLLVRDESLRRRVVDAARERVREFGLDRAADKTMAMYEEILRRKGRGTGGGG